MALVVLGCDAARHSPSPAATTAIDPSITPTLAISDAVLDPDFQINYGTATFNVALSAVPDSAVTVTWATSDGSAQAVPDPNQIRNTEYLLGDYGDASGQLTFDPGVPDFSLTQQIVIPTNPSSIGGDFYVTLSSADAPITVARGRASLPNALAPLISLYTPPANASQRVSLTYVTLSRPATHDVVVHWRTIDGTAVAPVDYAAARGTLHYAMGEADSKTIFVSLTPRKADTATFQIVFETAEGAPLVSTTVMLTQDGSLPVASIQNADVVQHWRIVEGDVVAEPASIRFPVKISRAYNQEVLLGWRMSFADLPSPASPDQFQVTTPLEGLVEFAPGETDKWIELALSTDLPKESPRERQFRIELLTDILVNATATQPAAVGRIEYSDAPSQSW